MSNYKFLPSSRGWVAITLLSVLIVIFWQHIVLLTRILSLFPLWSAYSSNLSLSLTKDGFDTSFEKYPVQQWSAQWPPRYPNASYPPPDSNLLRLRDGSLARLPDQRYGGGVSYSEPDQVDLVPPVLHHVLLGMDPKSIPKSWQSSRNNCLALHPESGNYTHHFWDDHLAEKFMRQHYPFFLRDFLDYRHNIQRADALRYFILHHYGGIFLDMDIECRRSLGPLRRFPIVNINASPVGVSNGFMMAQARHPFLNQLIKNLKYYDRTWLGIPYLDIILSTGPMFLSLEHLRFEASERPSQLRVLGEIHHRLNGRVVTPLFRHLGASSWHQGDAKLIRKIRELVNQPFISFMMFCGLIGGTAGWLIWKRQFSKRGVDRHWTYHIPAAEARRLLSGRLILWRFGFGSRRRRRRTTEDYENIEMEGDSDDLLDDRRLSPIIEGDEEEEAIAYSDLNFKRQPVHFAQKLSTSKNMESYIPIDKSGRSKISSDGHSGANSSISCPSTTSDSEDDGSEEAVVVLIDSHPSNWRS